jgi:hypothetical protein
MKIGKTIGGIIKAALLVGLIYAVVTWRDVDKVDDDDVRDFAEQACITEIGHRYNVSKARVYAVNENNNGYTVRVTVTLAKGNIAKVNCLTNTHGGVKDITIEER